MTITLDGTNGITTPALENDGVTTVAPGSASAPAIITDGDTNTGIFFPAADTIAFSEGGTEAARFDSSGNLLVGTTTAEGKVTIRCAVSDFSAFTLSTEAQDGTNQLRVRGDGAVYMGLDGASPYNLTNGAGANAVLLSDGFLYRSTSSLRYKRDIENLTHGLAKVLELRPVTYKGISPSDSENVYSGFIAEEVHAAGLTEFVQYDNEGQPDALHYGNMVALMAKAIQELSAKNDALEARIAALEGAQT